MTCDSCLNRYGCSEARFGESVRCMRFRDESEKEKDCKDCLHYEPCKNGFLPFEFDEKVTCRSFVNKAEWLHLPCEIGSTVYVDTGTWGGLYKFCRPIYICGEAFAIATIVSITATKRQKFIKLAVVTKDGTRRFSRYPFGSIGYTVFFTTEEAEKALAERNG